MDYSLLAHRSWEDYSCQGGRKRTRLVDYRIECLRERNAAAIRRAATRGSQHISLSAFSAGGDVGEKTVVLLDEVDHLSGGFAQVSEDKIDKILSPEEEENATIKGDSGGKAEL